MDEMEAMAMEAEAMAMEAEAMAQMESDFAYYEYKREMAELEKNQTTQKNRVVQKENTNEK